MRKLFKKSLACVLAVALCLTAMVGVLSVSADVTGTLDVQAFGSNVGENPYVIATFASADANELISEAFIKVEGASIASVAPVDGATGYAVELNDAKDIFNINSENGVASAAVKVVLDVTEAGEYTIKFIDVTSATDSQQLITFPTVEATVEVVAPHVHTEEVIPEVPATCEGKGFTAGVKCSECDEVLTAPTEVPALGHNYVDGVCDRCGEADPDYKPECEHIDANQDGICDNECGYENLDATLTFHNKAMNLGADISGVYQIRNYKKDNKFANVYVSFKIIAEKTGVKSELELFNTSDRANYTTYSYKLTVLAREMADIINARIVGITAEGEAFISNVDTWSIKEGLISNMKSASTGELTDKKLNALKLAANMLNYGAEAQKNFSYNLDNLATDDLPEEYAQYIITETPKMSAIPKVDDTGATAPLKSIDFNLGERIMVLPSFTVPKEDVKEIYSAVVSQVHTAPDGTVTTKDYTIEGKDCIKSNRTIYVKFNDFASQDLRDVLTLTLYKNGVAVSATHTFSAESALVGKLADNASLVAAIMNYGDCARAYFV